MRPFLSSSPFKHLAPIRTLPWRYIIVASPQRYGLTHTSPLCARLFSCFARPWERHDTHRGDTTLPVPVALRAYQEDCVQAVLQAFRDERRQVGISLATGSGKTVIFTELIGRVPPHAKDATRTLILVHRRELVEQAVRHCAARYPDKVIEVEMGNLRASGSADITIASVQSINSKDRIHKYDPRRYKLLLVDEAHHIVAPGYLKVLEHFGLATDPVDARSPGLVGVSATFSRFDGLSLGKVIKHIVYHRDYVDMIGEKWLSDVVFTTVQSGADLSKVRRSANGDFLAPSLSKAVNRRETNLVTVRTWITRAAKRHSTLVFCVDIQHVVDMTELFRKHGYDARYVTGATPVAERASTIQAFKDHEFPILVNCGVFTEGTDLPNTDAVIIARPTRSRNLLVQMIGRGMRLHAEKRNCHVIDMVASIEGGIITTPTLFGLDPSEVVIEASAEQMRQMRHRSTSSNEHSQTSNDHLSTPDTWIRALDPAASIRFTDYENVTDLISDTSGDRHIRALSQNSWVSINPDKYVLANGTEGSYLVLEKQSPSDVFIVKLIPSSATMQADIPSEKRPRFLRRRLIANAQTLEAAVHAADTYAAHNFVRAFILRHGPLSHWRGNEATPAQISFLNRLGADRTHAPLDTTSISKGQAMDMITKLKHGAKGVMKQIEKVRRRKVREELKEQKWEQQQAREVVRVGPVPSPASAGPCQ